MWARKLVVTLGLAVAMSVCVGALFSIGDGLASTTMAINTAIAMLYSMSIGVPATLIFPRIKPRLFGRPQLSQWLAYIGTLLAITLCGTLATRFVLFAIGLATWSELW